MSLLKWFFKEENLKNKIISASKTIEKRKFEISNLRLRLENRRQSLFEQVVRAIERKETDKASVYASELCEIKKVLRVVTVSELSLIQMILRLESIHDVGDVSVYMDEAFKVMKSIGPKISGVMPALEHATDDVKSMLSETLVDLGNLSPSISIDIKSDDGSEIIEKAKLYADQRAQELKSDIPQSITSAKGENMVEKTKKIALLATGESSFEEPFKPTIFLKSEKNDGNAVEEKVYTYVTSKNGCLNILEASVSLNMPAENVEKAVIKMVSDGKLKLGN